MKKLSVMKKLSALSVYALILWVPAQITLAEDVNDAITAADEQLSDAELQRRLNTNAVDEKYGTTLSTKARSDDFTPVDQWLNKSANKVEQSVENVQKITKDVEDMVTQTEAAASVTEPVDSTIMNIEKTLEEIPAAPAAAVTQHLQTTQHAKDEFIPVSQWLEKQQHIESDTQEGESEKAPVDTIKSKMSSEVNEAVDSTKNTLVDRAANTQGEVRNKVEQTTVEQKKKVRQSVERATSTAMTRVKPVDSQDFEIVEIFEDEDSVQQIIKAEAEADLGVEQLIEYEDGAAESLEQSKQTLQNVVTSKKELPRPQVETAATPIEVQAQPQLAKLETKKARLSEESLVDMLNRGELLSTTAKVNNQFTKPTNVVTDVAADLKRSIKQDVQQIDASEIRGSADVMDAVEINVDTKNINVENMSEPSGEDYEKVKQVLYEEIENSSRENININASIAKAKAAAQNKSSADTDTDTLALVGEQAVVRTIEDAKQAILQQQSR